MKKNITNSSSSQLDQKAILSAHNKENQEVNNHPYRRGNIGINIKNKILHHKNSAILSTLSNTQN